MRALCRTRILRCSHQGLSSGRYMLAVFLAVALTLPAGADVRRRLNVNSNPPGALVYVDNQQIGYTPCSVDFTYYGTREIRLIKPGFETLTVNQPIPAPWYQYVPLDFVSEILVPTKIRDNRTVCYNLSPQLVVPNDELLARANQLRQDAGQNALTPAGPALPVGATPAPTAPPPVFAPPAQNPIPNVAPPPFSQPVVPQPVPTTPPSGAPLLPQRP